MARVLDGRAYARLLRERLRDELKRSGIVPQLAAVLVGNDKPSHTYVGLKDKASREVGITFHRYVLEAGVGTGDVMQVVDFLNEDQDVDAIIVQLPLPAQVDTDLVVRNVEPSKDADGFHPDNVRHLLAGDPAVLPPGLAEGIVRLAALPGESLRGQRATIVAKSPVLVEPLAKLLADREVVVEWVKPTALNLAERTSGAHLLITAAGRPFLLGADHVRPGATVIDLGVSYLADGAVVGDVDYTRVFPIAGWITPVPGGMGPVTVAMLLWRTYQLACRHLGQHVPALPEITIAEVEAVAAAGPKPRTVGQKPERPTKKRPLLKRR